jgi:hypothetical protein
MKFEIADWRFEVTWDGLLCQPIERGRSKAAKKPAAQSDRYEGQPRMREQIGPSRDRTCSSNFQQTNIPKNLHYRKR